MILVDNQLGAALAAEEIIDYCETEGIRSINIIICEGNFHKRGYYFRNELVQRAQKTGLEICFLDRLDMLSFSYAITKAHDHVKAVIEKSIEDVKKRDTFIFCANDNLAIGARMGVIHFDSGDGGSLKPIRIFCFDATAFVKFQIDQGDKFFWRAIDQRYIDSVGVRPPRLALPFPALSIRRL